MATENALREYWQTAYESTDTPFDLTEPDEWIAALEADGRIAGPVMDSGCGPGRTAIYLAARGYIVTGVDIACNAIDRAKEKAAARSLPVDFRCENVLEIARIGATFQTVIDIGCFHSLYTDADRARYTQVLAALCVPGATMFLRAFSDRNPRHVKPGQHSPDLHEDQVRNAFDRAEWNLERLEEREIDLRLSETLVQKAWVWFAEIRRR